MKDNDPVVGCEPQVAFDPGVSLERRGEGEQAVLGESRAVVKAAMGEPGRAGPKGISGPRVRP